MSILPRYALRKTKLGCVSMLIAVGFFLGGANELNVKADALPAQNGKTAKQLLFKARLHQQIMDPWQLLIIVIARFLVMR